MLTQRDLMPYLLDRGLITSREVVENAVRILDVSRHNRNYHVSCEGGPSYLIKQGGESSGVGSVAHEAAIYRLLGLRPDLVVALPTCHGYDAAERLLILEFLSGSRDVRDYHARTHRFPKRFAALAGSVLAALHCSGPGDPGEVPTMIPPVLFINRPTAAMLQSISGGNLRLITTVQRFPELCVRLDDVRDGWRSTALIHGDARWDNFLIERHGRRPSLRLIDWESASWGDPCWDAGAFLSDYLGYWLFSIPVAGDLPPDRLAAQARVPLTRLQPAMRTFWAVYTACLGLSNAEADEWLVRTVRYAAVRLIERALEQMDVRIDLSGMVIFLLQMSMNMLRRPEAAAAQLLGITKAGRRLP